MPRSRGGMALVAGTLYVARCGSGTIDEINTATLVKTGSFGADVAGACDLAAAGGRLWYQGTGTLKSISWIRRTPRSRLGARFRVRCSRARRASPTSWSSETPESVPRRGRVNAKGKLNVTLKPTANTLYTARWSGDASHAATTAKGRRVQVRVTMHARTKGGYTTSGGYRLYHYATSCSSASHAGCPTFAGSATPSHPGYTFRVTSQAFLGGHWKTVVKGQGDSNVKGKLVVTIFYTNTAAVGVRQRIHFSLADHSDHLGNHSAWTYLKVT